ncbi:MAG: hypothetical protein ABEJ40_00065 [Haloarculaceae archaeon]
MPQDHVPGESGPPVAVGQELGPGSAPDDVLPSVVEERADGSERYIAYSAVVTSDRIEDYWLSVDLDAVVSRELWR